MNCFVFVDFNNILKFSPDEESHQTLKMGQGKVHVVEHWSTLSTRRKVQWFLGFANF